jgi:hypothetical protein
MLDANLPLHRALTSILSNFVELQTNLDLEGSAHFDLEEATYRYPMQPCLVLPSTFKPRMATLFKWVPFSLRSCRHILTPISRHPRLSVTLIVGAYVSSAADRQVQPPSRYDPASSRVKYLGRPFPFLWPTLPLRRDVA